MSPKSVPSCETFGPPTSPWFYWPRVLHPDRFIRFCWADGLDQQTDTHTQRQTGHATAVSVAIGHIYIASGAMLRYEFVDELEVGLLM